MALESAVYINGLNTSNPLSTDTVSQADDHLRLIKSVLKNTFPNLNAPVTATPAQLNSPVPVGGVIMWTGATIPTGWYLCDGTNGTPDLRDRFIVGSGSSYALGATGGAAQVTLSEAQIPSHTHAISATASETAAGAHSHSVSDPGHSHTVVSPVAGSTNASAGGFYGQGGSTTTGAAATGISIASAAAHTHAITVNAAAATTGGGTAHENRPPYYALAFIMKA